MSAKRSDRQMQDIRALLFAQGSRSRMEERLRILRRHLAPIGASSLPNQSQFLLPLVENAWASADAFPSFQT